MLHTEPIHLFHSMDPTKHVRTNYRRPSVQLLHVFVILKEEIPLNVDIMKLPFHKHENDHLQIHSNGIVSLSSLQFMSHRSIKWFHRSHIKSAMSTLGLKLVDIKKSIAIVFSILHDAKIEANNEGQNCKENATIDVPLALGTCKFPAASCVGITQDAFESITLSAISTSKLFNALHSPVLLNSSLNSSSPMILFLSGTSGTGCDLYSTQIDYNRTLI
jgi:hypothetical protein